MFACELILDSLDRPLQAWTVPMECATDGYWIPHALFLFFCQPLFVGIFVGDLQLHAFAADFKESLPRDCTNYITCIHMHNINRHWMSSVFEPKCCAVMCSLAPKLAKPAVATVQVQGQT